MSQVADKLIGEIPLFAGIERAELEGFLRIFQPIAFDTGAHMIRQGQPADGAFIIESGGADVITALPGGGTAPVAALGPGSVLGEMALLEGGARSATVIARSPVVSHFIERDGFRMLLAQRNRAAFTIQNRVTRTLCQRLRELNGKIAIHDAPHKSTLATTEPLPVRGRREGASFDYKSFLTVLPLFRRFGAAELERLAGLARACELERGTGLFRQGDTSEACYIVVRGAIEIAIEADGHRQRIGILGPGRLCGVLALIEGQPHSMSAYARERATLMELPQRAFEQLFAGDDRLSALFQDAINRELLRALARTNVNLTRLISQACIRGGRLEQARAAELQCALVAQDCRAA